MGLSRKVIFDYSTIFRTLPHPSQGSLNGLSSVVIEFGVPHAGHSITGNAIGFDSDGIPFFLGLAIAVIVHSATEIPATAPTVNGLYPRNSARSTTGIKIISIQSAPRLLFLVRVNANHIPPPTIAKVINDRLRGAFNKLLVG